VQVGIYRSFIIVICGTLAIGLQLALMRTRFGSRLRAAVDDARVARGLGIPVGTVFAVTFAVGRASPASAAHWAPSFWASIPNFPLKFMIYFLDRGHGRRHLGHPGAVRRLAAAGRGRRCGQVLRAGARRPS
jgi:branched-chain amino acid transport system permease protein